MEQLLDDILADILGRLPPSSLAASRCVRKHWCSIIDARRLLRADLLPLRLDAFFCISLDFIERLTYFFARPSTARRIPGNRLDFIDGEDYSILEVKDHCNGLLLVYDMVVNPATRQWATLPISPEPSIDYFLMGFGGTTMEDQKNDDHLLSSRFYLVYDPMAESPQHFEVFLFPLLGRDLGDHENITINQLEEQEWPPSTFRTHVFSSARWRWEERSWIRQGEPAGTMADMLMQSDCWNRKGVYFRGALYVHCQNDSGMRIALSSDKYQMMRSPAAGSKLGEDANSYLGKSEKGVYFALLDWDWFRVWLLKEEISDGHHIHMEWVLKTKISLQPLLSKLPLHSFANQSSKPWTVINKYNKEEVPPVAAAHDDEFAHDEWDFDNADVVCEAKDNEAEAERYYYKDFLGFHPYKEIVFFCVSSGTISYNLNTSKVQQLGGRIHIPVGIKTCFPYTPCWIRKLFEKQLLI